MGIHEDSSPEMNEEEHGEHEAMPHEEEMNEERE